MLIELGVVEQRHQAVLEVLGGLPRQRGRPAPPRYFALAKQRQRHVLDRLVAAHYLTVAQASAAYRAPLRVRVVQS